MVEAVRRWLGKANQKQKQYLANLFTIAGGTMIFSVWQTIYPYSASAYHWQQILVNLCLLVISTAMLKLGYECLGDQ